MKTTDSSNAGHSMGQGVVHYLDTALQGLRYRGELLSIEWREEKKRLFRVVLGAVVAALSGSMALGSINLLVLLLYWDTHRVAVTVGFTVLYGAVALGVALTVRHLLLAPDKPFQATFEELRKDRERFLSAK